MTTRFPMASASAVAVQSTSLIEGFTKTSYAPNTVASAWSAGPRKSRPTPRILDLATKNVANLEKCNLLVLDEVDKLLSQDFAEIVEKIIKIMPEPQIALFSATYPQEIKAFQEKYVHKPQFIKPTDELTLKGLTQYYAYLEEKEKLHCLTTLFNKLEIS